MDSKKYSAVYEPYVYNKKLEKDTAYIKSIRDLSLALYRAAELSMFIAGFCCCLNVYADTNKRLTNFVNQQKQIGLETLLVCGEASLEARGSKKVPWGDDDPDYMYASEAIVKFTNGKMPVPTLSKLLTPEGPIRYMRRGRRCKVHVGEFIRYVRQHYLSDAFAAVISEEHIADIEARKLQERRKKTNK